MKKILITGGAGFIGSSLALMLKKYYQDIEVTVLDNLKRKGSAFNLNRLEKKGIKFIHGDIRNKSDLDDTGDHDTLLECSAEPSVTAGYDSSPQYLLDTNLFGTVNCLEYARKNNARVIFLSTSRVYPISYIKQLKYTESETRFDLNSNQNITGISQKGIAEDFPLDAPRSLYGTTKLASELIINEYSDIYNLEAVINRCSIITGPGQMGKVDQGVVALWVARHFYKKPLAYFGYNGSGKQVRDMLHIDDLVELIRMQLDNTALYKGQTFNVGGGEINSSSLSELTAICQQITGNQTEINQRVEESPADIPWFIINAKKVSTVEGWQPRISVPQIVDDIYKWLKNNKKELKPFF